jgi:hypothetical protein
MKYELFNEMRLHGYRKATVISNGDFVSFALEEVFNPKILLFTWSRVIKASKVTL